jgi:hypothetical protein
MRTLVLCVVLLVLLPIGCGRSSGPASGKANLQIWVLAEPKSGAEQPAAYDSYGNSSSNLGSGKYELVDYAALDNIVVYLQPADSIVAPAATDITLPIDLKKPADALMGVVSVSQKVTLQNTGTKPANFYSQSDGNNFDLGIISPGESASWTVQSPGTIEIWTDSLQNPVGVLYAAPNSLCRLTQAGTIVEFKDLAPGQYKIVSWHPRLPGHFNDVTLSPDQVTKTTIQVTVNGLPVVPVK